MRRHNGGFSLIEVSIGLVLSTALGLIALRYLGKSHEDAISASATSQFNLASTVVEGFAVRNYRLPCPDTDSDGLENCEGGSIGYLPWRDLQLPPTFANLRYGVYRSSSVDLSKRIKLYTPLLPPDERISNAISGLDLCVALRTAARTSAVGNGLTAAGVDVAYAFAHPGLDGKFQGSNTGGFDFPRRGASIAYDDDVYAVGLPEFSGRLACPAQLGRANTAILSNYVAYEIVRDRIHFANFKEFTKRVRETALIFATIGLSSSIVELALAGTTIVNQIVEIIVKAKPTEAVQDLAAVAALLVSLPIPMTAVGLSSANLVLADQANNSASEQAFAANALLQDAVAAKKRAEVDLNNIFK